MKYEFKQEDAIGFAHFLGVDTKVDGDELNFFQCPYCQSNDRDDRWKFSINLESGCYHCFRASCGASGFFIELARDFDYPLQLEAPTIYRQLKQPKGKIQTTDYAITYLQSRGISEEIAKRYEMTTRIDNDRILVIPFRDEGGTLVTVKYRNTVFDKKSKKPQDPKERFEKDTMPILFGMYQCKDFSRLIITEGQIDALSVAQAGIDNAVSVPTGANGMKWFLPCREWVSKFQEIIVFGDCENGKITLVDELKARVTQTLKVVRKQDYLGEKDANDILRNYGTRAIVKAIENAELPKIDNVKMLSSVKPVDINELDKIKTGIPDLDKTIKGLCVGQLGILTGPRGEGKSTLGSQIICSALNQGESVFAYSGELADFHFKFWLDAQLAGSKNMSETYDEFNEPQYSIDSDVEERITEWYKGRMYIYDNDYIPSNKSEYESLPQTVEKVIKEYGCRLIFIDNLMTAMDSVTDASNLNLAQSNFVGELKKIAMKYQVIILLVAHPRKTMSGQALKNDDVSGSSDITNKADIVMTYTRGEGVNQGLLQVTKNRLFGQLRVGSNAIMLEYSPKSRRVFDPSPAHYPSKTIEEYHYGWELHPGKKYIEMKEVVIPPKPPEPKEEDEVGEDGFPF